MRSLLVCKACSGCGTCPRLCPWDALRAVPVLREASAARQSPVGSGAQRTEALRAARGWIEAGALLLFAFQRGAVVLQLQQSHEC